MKNKPRRTQSIKPTAGRPIKSEPRGFRKIHFGTEVYLWRYYGDKVEIRPPSASQKWIVPIWTIQGLTQAEWEKENENSDGDFGYAYAVSPSLIRGYIDAQRKLC